MHPASSNFKASTKRRNKFADRVRMQQSTSMHVGNYLAQLCVVDYDRNSFDLGVDPSLESDIICTDIKQVGIVRSGIRLYDVNAKLVSAVHVNDMAMAIASFIEEVGMDDDGQFSSGWPYTLVSLTDVQYGTHKKSQRIERAEYSFATLSLRKAEPKAEDAYSLIGTVEGNSVLTDADGVTAYTITAKTRGEPLPVQNGMGIYLKEYD